jgi:hypothetical protein
VIVVPGVRPSREIGVRRSIRFESPICVLAICIRMQVHLPTYRLSFLTVAEECEQLGSGWQRVVVGVVCPSSRSIRLHRRIVYGDACLLSHTCRVDRVWRTCAREQWPLLRQFVHVRHRPVTAWERRRAPGEGEGRCMRRVRAIDGIDDGAHGVGGIATRVHEFMEAAAGRCDDVRRTSQWPLLWLD